MKNLMIITVLLSVATLLQAECRCVNHSPADHLDMSDARAIGKEIGKNTPRKVVNNIKEGVSETVQNIEDDMNDVNNKIQKSQTVQSAKDALKCMCDKSKCLMHGAKKKGEEVVDETKELASKAGQFTKEVISKGGNTIKETAYKVGHDIQEGAMEVKDDFVKAKERAKHS